MFCLFVVFYCLIVCVAAFTGCAGPALINRLLQHTHTHPKPWPMQCWHLPAALLWWLHSCGYVYHQTFLFICKCVCFGLVTALCLSARLLLCVRVPAYADWAGPAHVCTSTVCCSIRTLTQQLLAVLAPVSVTSQQCCCGGCVHAGTFCIASFYCLCGYGCTSKCCCTTGVSRVHISCFLGPVAKSNPAVVCSYANSQDLSAMYAACQLGTMSPLPPHHDHTFQG
jgi:hypothetical protein